ncbi:zinc ribbon domain-containing protein [Priestia aryabhattai]
MKFCNSCGEKLKRNRKFCVNCGQQFEKDVKTTRVNKLFKPRQKENTAPKKSSKKSKVMVISIVLGAAILGGAYYGINKMLMQPKAIAEGFIDAVKKNDIAKVEKYVNEGLTELKANDSQTQAFITYLQKNPEAMSAMTDDLSSYGKNTTHEDSIYPSYAHLEQNGKKWFIFNRYVVRVSPMYVTVKSGEDKTMVYVDGKGEGLIHQEATEKMGPFLPGDHVFKGAVKNEYGTATTEQIVKSADTEAIVDFDWSNHEVHVSSDYDDATLFVNNEDTKTEIGDIDYLGPLPMDGSVNVYAKREFDSGEKKTEAVSIKKGMTEIALNFDEESTSKVSAPVKEEEENHQDSNTDSGVSTSEVSSFIEQYMNATISSINSGDFTIAEPYIDSNGPKYKEQKEYTGYLINKGITEDLLSFNVNRVTKLDDSMYKVYTTEEYDISYGDGSVKYKKFNSIHKVKELSDGSLGVYQLVSSTEVK